jgi:aspartate ammonia-lyase
MITAPPKDRTEKDALGSRTLPRDALYGVHSLRGGENFPVSGRSIGSIDALVRAMALVKKAAARANARLGHLPPEKAEVIARVCDEIIAGQHRAHFIVDVFQGGGGTSTHMNMNEVIANRGLELMGRTCGDYAHLHPIDDVNLSQSSNDIHETALRLALIQGAGGLEEALLGLADTLAAKDEEFRGVVELGRTHLQDAVPMTLSQEFGAFASAVRREAARTRPVAAALRDLNLGGTAAGTGIAARPDFARAVIDELARLTALPLEPAEDLVRAAWDASDLAQFSAMLRGVGLTLSKIASDLRLLASGPHGGIGEIVLPAVQPGSSQMPGKVNPVVPEMVNQVAFYVAGADVSVGMAVEAGQLQHNPFEPLIAYSLLTSLRLLDGATRLFAARCVHGIKADSAVCARHLGEGAALITALVPLLGHEAATRIASELAAGHDLRALLEREGDLDAAEIERLLALQTPPRATAPTGNRSDAHARRERPRRAAARDCRPEPQR